MTLELHLRLAGIGMILLALVHLTFPHSFQWREELARLSLLNRQMFLVHTFFVCLVLVMMGALSSLGTHALLTHTPLSRWVLGGIALFWGVRLVFQWFVYDRSLWRGKPFETVVHVVFTMMWSYLTALYAWACWSV